VAADVEESVESVESVAEDMVDDAVAVPGLSGDADGPFDIEDFDDPAQATLARLDLGSVLIPMQPDGQVQVELKEVKLRPKTDDHDLEVKVKHIRRFLEDGNKVKVTCRFRGREITHPETAEVQLVHFIETTKDIAIVEQTPRMEAKTMTILLSPKAEIRARVAQQVAKRAELDKQKAIAAKAGGLKPFTLLRSSSAYFESRAFARMPTSSQWSVSTDASLAWTWKSHSRNSRTGRTSSMRCQTRWDGS
jgi:hypothetical protein